jgi:hypothetical protein
MDDGDDGAREFPFSTYCCIPLHSFLAYVNQPKSLVSNEGYRLVITTFL